MDSLSPDAAVPYDEALTRTAHHIDAAIRGHNNVALLLVYLHGVERLCATLGHIRTGQLLTDFTTHLSQLARNGDLVERIADRKFAVLLNGMRNRGHITLAAHKVERLARQIASNEAHKLKLEATIGVVLCPEQGDDAHELMRSAEIASLDGRRKHETVCFYEIQAADQLVWDWGLERRLIKALKNCDLQLYYQPKLCLKNGYISGAEALMRWRDVDLGWVSPEVFIEVAEATGNIADLTHFAIQRCCHQLHQWRQVFPQLQVSVNITPSIAQDVEVIDVLRSAVSIWDIAPKHLTMEVTESALMTDPAASHDILTRIRQFGTKVSIDDFGTGYSSLAYLKDIPADELKIDRSFVMGMLADQRNYKIIEHAIGIAKSFGLQVVAEGVESKVMLDQLRQLGCDYAQGHYICRPVPVGEFETFCQHASDNAWASLDGLSAQSERDN